MTVTSKIFSHAVHFCHEEIRLEFTLLMLLPVLQSLKCCSDEEQTAWSEGCRLYHHRPPRIQIFLMWPCSAFFTGHTCYQVSVGVADVHTAAPPTICLTSFLMGDVVPSPEQTHSRNAHMRYMGRAVPAMQNKKKTYITCLLSENVMCIMREGLKMWEVTVFLQDVF